MIKAGSYLHAYLSSRDKRKRDGCVLERFLCGKPVDVHRISTFYETKKQHDLYLHYLSNSTGSRFFFFFVTLLHLVIIIELA